MSFLPQSLYTGEQVRELDRFAIESFGISGTVLMERAGAAAFQFLQHRWPKAKSITVVCGTGNNGGDGFVVARLAKEQGLAVRVLQVGDGSRLKGDALSAAQRLEGAEVQVQDFTETDLAATDLIVDALLGTGLSGEVSGDYRQAVEWMNAADKSILALDIPSGLHADTGLPLGATIRASATVSFIGLKQGLLTAQGPEHTGELVFASLSVPEGVYEMRPPAALRIDYARLKKSLSPRPRDTHKGQCGHVLVMGGESGFSGAARLAGEAAARVGAGLVSIATRPEHAALLSASRPELMCHGVEDEEAFARLAARATVLVVGPGLGQSEWSQTMLDLAVRSGLPLVVDADGLNLLAEDAPPRSDWVLTPHPGEAGRLLDKTAKQIEQDRFAAVTQLSERYGGTVVLKGTGTLVKTAEQTAQLCNAGNPGMASGGMGDVLSGVIAGLLAQGLGQAAAAALGVALHAEAADQAVKGAGERGLLASDLMPWVRRLANPDIS